MKSPLAIEQEDDGEDEPYELDYDLCDEEQKSNKEQEMTDMRQLIRELGENGEKFDVEDRSFGKDYIEDFEDDS